MHTPFFNKLNNGELADIMNHPIPNIGGTLMNAIPLSRFPKDLAYNMRHHGILKVDFARGQRQQYNVITATGKVFVVGATHTYYTHNRKVINFLEYGEKHDVYKFFVHSTANYHFACKSPYPQPYAAGANRPIGASVVNYRYEGNFNIEQVTTAPWTYSEADGSNTSAGGGLVNYIQGIHGILKEDLDLSALRFRSPKLEFISSSASPYKAGGELPRNVDMSMLTFTSSNISMKTMGVNDITKSSIEIDLNKLTITANQVIVNSTAPFDVKNDTIFNGNVAVAQDKKLSAKNIAITRVVGIGDVTLSGNYNFG
jgi:hypothetical protein